MKISVNKLIILLAQLLLLSCVDSSPYLGNNIVPPDQQMVTKIDSSINISTYTIALDSIDASNLGAMMYLGQYNSDMVGRTTSQLFANYSPLGFDDEAKFKNNFGKEPRIDSLIIEMSVTYKSGDSLKKSKLEIFRVTKFNFKKDSIYYSNFNIDPYIDPTPLLTVELTGTKVLHEKLPLEYAKEHIDTKTDTSSTYFSTLNFHKKFNGLYFKVTPEQSEGALYKIDLQNSYMSLYYNNKDDVEHPDTVLSHAMLFYTNQNTQTPYNTTLQMYKHDFGTAKPNIGGVDPLTINDTVNAQKRAYVSGFGGLGSLVEFSSADILNFIEKAKHEAGPNVGIAVHRAEIVWNKIDKTWQNLDISFNALGFYYDINKFKFIQDYDPIYLYQNDQSNNFGLIDRSTGKYTMDITRYVQQMVRGGKVYNKLQMFSEFYQETDPGESVVWGSLADSKEKPYLVITYTLIK